MGYQWRRCFAVHHEAPGWNGHTRARIWAGAFLSAVCPGGGDPSGGGLRERTEEHNFHSVFLPRRPGRLAKVTRAAFFFRPPSMTMQCSFNIDERIPCPTCGGQGESCTTCANTGWCPPIGMEISDRRVDSVRAAWPLFQAAGGGSIPTSALQLQVFEISVQRAMRLNAEWHSVLPITDQGNLTRNRRYTFYGAEYDHVWYAVAIWTDPVAANRLTDGETALELRRLAIAPDAPKNTASRLLAIMRRRLTKKYPELTRLISYQSVEHHAGTIYKAAGWSQASESAFVSWQNRDRLPDQITSAKVRWEFKLGKE